ncbi:MAG: trimeric intracellular cation channel family protein [Saprospiraceae bacterium]|nr:trimeric intracellular cation channel family protein [Bacteroidia bacterium]NNF34258.1 trimeric intracellular cation channel family protein [Saprospiraceae bacterium]
MELLYVADLVGTFVFAISGVMVASAKKFDVFGAFVIAFVTAIGGGTLRDILIGSLPVGWIQDVTYIFVIMVACLCSVLFSRYIINLSKTLFLFDTIGIAVFTILGLQKALDVGTPAVVAVMMGTISAVFGGVVRDVLCNEEPLIFRKELYATPCIFGGVLYLILDRSGLIQPAVIGITIAGIIIVRLLAVKRHWSLPLINLEKIRH